MTIKEAIEVLKDGELNPCVAEDKKTCDMVIDILKEIEMCDETSATKCFTCVNEIKDLINRSNLL